MVEKVTAAQVTAAQALAFRLRRQHLDPVDGGGAVDVARRLCGVQAQVASSAQLAVALRQSVPDPGAVDAALAERRLVKTWAMRGTLHLLPADDAPAWLTPLATLRPWEKASWQKAFGVDAKGMARLADSVGEALTDRVLTRDELVREIVARPGMAGLEEQLRSGWSAVLKPLAWQGVLCQGPSQGNRVTFTRPDTWLRGWAPVPDVDEAATRTVPAYLRAYGPATAEAFDRYLTRGTSPKAAVRRRFEAVADLLADVEVDGAPMSVLAEDVVELCAIRPSSVVRLLGPFDQYVLGPSTSDPLVLEPAHRSEVSRAAGWISAVVLDGGHVVGVWETGVGGVDVRLFPGSDGVAPAALAAEVERVTGLLAKS